MKDYKEKIERLKTEWKNFCEETMEKVEQIGNRRLDEEIKTWIPQHIEVNGETGNIFQSVFNDWAEVVARHFYHFAKKETGCVDKEEIVECIKTLKDKYIAIQDCSIEVVSLTEELIDKINRL